MGKVQTQSKFGKVGDTFGLISSFLSRQSWQISDITFLIMGKVQIQSKVGKVGDTFGLFKLLLSWAKLAKFRYNFSHNGQSLNPKQS